MDPTVTLAKIRELTEFILTVTDPDDRAEYAPELAEHVRALDEWITNGGYLPAEWADWS